MSIVWRTHSAGKFLICLNHSVTVPLFVIVFVIRLLWRLVDTYILKRLLVLRIITTFYECTDSADSCDDMFT